MNLSVTQTETVLAVMNQVSALLNEYEGVKTTLCPFGNKDRLGSYDNTTINISFFAPELMEMGVVQFISECVLKACADNSVILAKLEFDTEKKRGTKEMNNTLYTTFFCIKVKE